MTILAILVSTIVGFVLGVLVEKKNGLIARAEAGEQAAVDALKDKVGKL